MMKENKFRVWDGLRMTTSGIMFSTTGGVVFTAGGMPLMQYTGLSGKNVKEIWEGDIATVECECGYRANMPVEWGYNGFRLKKRWSHRFPSGELEFNHSERVEIKGNIYETPDLLEAK